MISLKAIKESEWVNRNLGSFGEVAQDIKNTGKVISHFPVRSIFTTIGVITVLVLSFKLAVRLGKIKSNQS